MDSVVVKQRKVVLSWPQWLTTYDHLGSHYPYYSTNGMEHGFSLAIAPILTSIPIENRKVDPIGVVEMLAKSYLLGNRTLIQGLHRSPWMGRPDGQGGWIFSDIPPHGHVRMPADQAAMQLKEALRAELLMYLAGRKHIGILLSGGLDSRVVAGILRELQLSGEFLGDVVALTWGLSGSRDVKYAQEIARRYKWEWVQIPLGPDILAENIRITGMAGAEFSPFHLHGMPQVSRLTGLDAVLAGSYGDSVGRAEFSGRHVLKLQPTVPFSLNRFGLVLDEWVRAVHRQVLSDAYAYRKHISRDKEYQFREIEQQMHYMRRKLQGCMSLIAERIPLFQAFTAPRTFALMWRLDPIIRGNQIYCALLPTLPGGIGKLPWARTGVPLEGAATQDEAEKEFHKYGPWLRNDLREFVTELVQSDAIRGLGIFNDRALDWLLRIWPRSHTVTTNSIDESVSWLASLALFVQHYNVQGPGAVTRTYRDEVNAIRGLTVASTYLAARERLRQ
ncbi:MAG TPA: hypothetical protein GX506_01860 [Firmicutes bacterium]|nr:hypothetical protein [Bacillota bacterium]